MVQHLGQGASNRLVHECVWPHTADEAGECAQHKRLGPGRLVGHAQAVQLVQHIVLYDILEARTERLAAAFPVLVD